MFWYHYVAYFFGGAFFANALPHLISGVMGRPFQSPFAKPPGEGLSSSTVNVVWGSANLLVSYLLIYHVGDFALGNWCHFFTAGIGALAICVFAAKAFGRFHGGNL